ncbi:MAG: helix-turn-helix transcriptional regulator [Firmicutes bacterium]|nr:helix-turn-helix transcriptional regulator [Bacillota bacterium]
MKLDKNKYEIARARVCMSSKEIIDAGIPKGTLYRIVNGEDVRPETIGKLAAILKVDITEIIED